MRIPTFEQPVSDPGSNGHKTNKEDGNALRLKGWEVKARSPLAGQSSNIYVRG